MSFLRRNILAVGIASLLVGGCVWIVVTPLHPRRYVPPGDQRIGGSNQELNEILNRLGESGGEAALKKWMAVHVVNGSTRMEVMIALFGQGEEQSSPWNRDLIRARTEAKTLHLDRPLRDQVRTLQFRLFGDQISGFFLVCEFDLPTRVLQDWGIVYSNE